MAGVSLALLLLALSLLARVEIEFEPPNGRRHHTTLLPEPLCLPLLCAKVDAQSQDNTVPVMPTSPIVLVRNTGFGIDGIYIARDYATAFTTGGHANGYTISSVALRLESVLPGLEAVSLLDPDTTYFLQFDVTGKIGIWSADSNDENGAPGWWTIANNSIIIGSSVTHKPLAFAIVGSAIFTPCLVITPVNLTMTEEERARRLSRVIRWR